MNELTEGVVACLVIADWYFAIFSFMDDVSIIATGETGFPTAGESTVKVWGF